MFTALNGNNNTFICYFTDYIDSLIIFIRHRFYVSSKFKSYSGESTCKPYYKNRLKSPITQRIRVLYRKRAKPVGHLVEKALSICKVHGKLKWLYVKGFQANAHEVWKALHTHTQQGCNEHCMFGREACTKISMTPWHIIGNCISFPLILSSIINFLSQRRLQLYHQLGLKISTFHLTIIL